MIIDTHVHIFDPLRPQGVPWPDPENELLYRTTLPAQVREAAEPAGVTGAVVVEASKWIEDNQWVLDTAEKDPFILGLVGRLEPAAADFEKDLERFASHPLFVGVRFPGSYFADIEANGFIDKMRLLAEKELVFDVNFPIPHRANFFALLERVPQLRVVVEHVGQVPVNGQTPPDEWMANMRRTAGHAQTSMKVSALMENCAEQPAPASGEYYRPALDAMWGLFGEDRLLYGSNWPVSQRAGTYALGMEIVRAYFAEKGPEAAGKFFYRNAQAIYGCGER